MADSSSPTAPGAPTGFTPSAALTPAAGPDGSLPPDRRGQPIDLEAARSTLQPLDAPARLAWALETFGDGLALTSSFGIQSAVLLHMVSELGRTTGGAGIPVIWVDTGYLPAETYRYVDQLCGLLTINLQVAQSDISPARMEALYGRLWETGQLEDLQLYNRLRKVAPLDQALRRLGVTCWASGVRGAQTGHRRGMQTLDPVRGAWSLRPLLSWSNRDIYYYMERHGLPQHPLFEQGYSTVGDWHTSAPDDVSQSGRATRFGGLKEECGIHLPDLIGGEGI